MCLVTIGLPVYNGETFLERAIESLLAQTHDDLRLVVADNASTDRTPEICAAWADADPRVRVLTSDVNRGAAWNFNRILAAARTPYFKWAAHDDVCHPRFLEACLEVLEADPRLVGAQPITVEVHADESPWRILPSPSRMGAERPSDRFASVVLDRHVNAHVFGLMRTRALAATRGIAPFFGSDVVLMAELALLGPMAEVPEILFWRREHGRTSQNAFDIWERLAWFDTDQSGRLNFPQWRMAREFLRALSRHPLPARERARSRAAMARYVVDRRGALFLDVAEGVKHVVRSTPPGRGLIHAAKRFRGPRHVPHWAEGIPADAVGLPGPPDRASLRAAAEAARTQQVRP